MALIEFKNLPDTTTPINATNLNKIQENSIYSLNEVEIGKWADNKPLYRKVINFNDVINFNNYAYFDYPHDIQNAKTVRIVSAGLFNALNNKYYPIPLVGYEGNFTDKLYCYADRTNIRLFGTAGGWGTDWYKVFVLEYTKTTD